LRTVSLEQRVLEAEEGVQGNQTNNNNNNNMTHLPTIEQRNESDGDGEAPTSSKSSKSPTNSPPPPLPPLPLLRQQESESPSSILLSENQINLEFKNGDMTRSMNHSASLSSSNDSIKSKKSSLLHSSPVSYRLEDLKGEGNVDGLVNLNFLSNTKKSEENRSYQHDY